MIIEEQGDAGGVVDSLNSTYHNLAGRSLETGYLHESPIRDGVDTHAGRVHVVDPGATHRQAVDKFGQHIKDHGGIDVKGYVPRNNSDGNEQSGGGNRSMITFRDGGQLRIAHITSRDGKHVMEFER